MIVITKEEAMAIRAKYGEGAGIAVTNRHKKGGRKNYYMPEEGRLLFFLERFRNKKEREIIRRKRGNVYGRN